MLFKDCLCFQVGRVARKMARVTRKKVASYGLTTTQFFLLTALYEEDGIPITALAQKVALDKATLTGLLDRLERDACSCSEPRAKKEVYKILDAIKRKVKEGDMTVIEDLEDLKEQISSCLSRKMLPIKNIQKNNG